MNILIPKTLTPDMFAPGTNIPEVDPYAAEVAWVSGGTYVVGDRRTKAHHVYECIKDANASPANTYEPDSANGAEFWFKDEEAPTNRWAPFDDYLFTKAKALGEVTYVLKPGFVTGVAVHGIEADQLTITATAGPGGPDLVPPIEADLWEQAYGEWEYLFGDLDKGTKHTVGGIPLHPDVHITITARRNPPDEEAAIGYISVGQWQRLFAPDNVTEAAMAGASAELRTYSYFKQNEQTGMYLRKKGRQSIDLSIPCTVPGGEGNRVRELLTQILDIPVAMEASAIKQLAWLSTVGFITGRISAPSKGIVEIDFTVKGNP